MLRDSFLSPHQTDAEDLRTVNALLDPVSIL